jgi:hypothetical protein
VRAGADQIAGGEKHIEIPGNNNYDRADPMFRPFILSAFCLFVTGCGRPVAAHDAASLLQPLIDPGKLATLRVRGANQRIQKITAILWLAKANGQDPGKVADKAVELIGWGCTEKGRLTAAEMVRNVIILARLRLRPQKPETRDQRPDRR